jgi:hypothetical protein
MVGAYAGYRVAGYVVSAERGYGKGLKNQIRAGIGWKKELFLTWAYLPSFLGTLFVRTRITFAAHQITSSEPPYEK